MKTILITGSTDGIGKLTAKKLANDGHQILLHGRNKEKLNQSILDVKAKSGNDNVSGLIADLSNFHAIKQLVTEVISKYSKIDVLINNAGVFFSKVETNKNGIDLRFAVNYLAPYLLTQYLIPLLKNSKDPRVINLSSAAQAPVSLQALMGSQTLNTQSAYAQSKLALTMWSFYMAKTYKLINTIPVNPGSLLNTKMVDEAYGQYWSSADKGATILYNLAVLDEYADKSGQYYDNDKGMFSNAHPDAYDNNKIEALISLTDKILDL